MIQEDHNEHSDQSTSAPACLDVRSQGMLREANKEQPLSDSLQTVRNDLFLGGSGSRYLRDTLGDAYTPLLPDGSENHELLHNFLSHVSFTTYKDYQPFVSRFLDNKSPRLSDVNNLLSPGLPTFIAHSSGTSGGQLKHFLKYPIPGRLGRRWDNPDVAPFKICSFSLLNIDRLIKIVDNDWGTVQDIPVIIATAGGTRLRLGIGPTDDAKIIDKKRFAGTIYWFT